MLSTSSHAIASKAENVLSDIISGQTSVRSRLKKVFIYYGNVETYHKEIPDVQQRSFTHQHLSDRLIPRSRAADPRCPTAAGQAPRGNLKP